MCSHSARFIDKYASTVTQSTVQSGQRSNTSAKSFITWRLVLISASASLHTMLTTAKVKWPICTSTVSSFGLRHVASYFYYCCYRSMYSLTNDLVFSPSFPLSSTHTGEPHQPVSDKPYTTDYQKVNLIIHTYPL